MWVSGYGLRTVHRNVSAGTHQIRATFTRRGIGRQRHHKRTSVRVKLIAGKQAVTNTMTVRL